MGKLDSRGLVVRDFNHPPREAAMTSHKLILALAVCGSALCAVADAQDLARDWDNYRIVQKLEEISLSPGFGDLQKDAKQISDLYRENQIDRDTLVTLFLDFRTKIARDVVRANFGVWAIYLACGDDSPKPKEELMKVINDTRLQLSEHKSLLSEFDAFTSPFTDEREAAKQASALKPTRLQCAMKGASLQ